MAEFFEAIDVLYLRFHPSRNLVCGEIALDIFSLTGLRRSISCGGVCAAARTLLCG